MLAVLVFAGYASIATMVRVFPFSTFDMYAHPETTASRLLARDASGQVGEVTRFGSWLCDGNLEKSSAPILCGAAGSFSFTPYQDQDLLHWVRTNPGVADAPRSEPVELVRRIWRLGNSDGPPKVEDCLVTRCRAVRR